MLIYLLCLPVAALLLFYLFIARVVVGNIKSMENGLEIVGVDLAKDYPEFADEIGESGVWTESKNFKPAGVYSTTISGNHFIIAAWKLETAPTYFMSYHVAGKVFFDFVTVYIGRMGLTTGSTQDGQMLPKPPGQYVQTFDLEPETLLTRHAEANAFLIREGGLKEQWVERSLADLINESLISQSRYVQTLLLWRLRGPWWYFVRRGKLHNRSVEELHKAGLARLPNNPKFKPFAE